MEKKLEINKIPPQFIKLLIGFINNGNRIAFLKDQLIANFKLSRCDEYFNFLKIDIKLNTC